MMEKWKMRAKLRVSLHNNCICTFEDAFSHDTFSFRADSVLSEEQARSAVERMGFCGTGIKFAVVVNSVDALGEWLGAPISGRVTIAVYGRDTCIIQSEEGKPACMLRVYRK